MTNKKYNSLEIDIINKVQDFNIDVTSQVHSSFVI